MDVAIEKSGSTLVTVLVAVYNAEKYLPACLRSLQAQTLKSIQVVCVDDASTDGSLQILRVKAQEDRRFEVVALKENVGQARARNEALKRAKGCYVAFLDSDDYLSADALEAAVATFETHVRTDCVLFNLVRFEETTAGRNQKAYTMMAFEKMNGKEAFLKSLNWTIHGVYVARRALYERFPFDDSSRAYSDDNTTRLHYYVSREVRTCHGIYYYRQHSGSVTHRISVRRFDYLRACESMKRQLLEMNVDKETLRYYENQRWLVLIDICMFYHFHHRELTSVERRYALQEIHRVRANIDHRSLRPRLKYKFGYAPMPAWWLFRLQEWCYFSLRKLLKNK